MIRNDQLKKDKPTLGIIDSKSIDNTDTAKEKGYDAGKKVSGIKIHVVCDTLGLPHAIHVTTADVTDRDGANVDAWSVVVKFVADNGYSGELFASVIRQIHGAEVEIVKRNELHQFVVLPKRWIVERSFGWLEKSRRLWKNCERKLHTTLEITVLTFISVLIRRF